MWSWSYRFSLGVACNWLLDLNNFPYHAQQSTMWVNNWRDLTCLGPKSWHQGLTVNFKSIKLETALKIKVKCDLKREATWCGCDRELLRTTSNSIVVNNIVLKSILVEQIVSFILFIIISVWCLRLVLASFCPTLRLSILQVLFRAYKHTEVLAS